MQWWNLLSCCCGCGCGCGCGCCWFFRRCHISWNFIWTTLDALFEMKITFAVLRSLVLMSVCLCAFLYYFSWHSLTLITAYAQLCQNHVAFVVDECDYLLATSFSTLDSTNKTQFQITHAHPPFLKKATEVDDWVFLMLFFICNF